MLSEKGWFVKQYLKKNGWTLTLIFFDFGGVSTRSSWPPTPENGLHTGTNTWLALQS